MPTHQFTVEEARAAGLRSAQLRAERKLLPKPEPIIPLPTLDPYVQELMRAQEETLAELRSAESAKDKASLAQALKNLRETYHLATGLAKPGVLKPVSQRPRQQSRELPDAPDSQ